VHNDWCRFGRSSGVVLIAPTISSPTGLPLDGVSPSISQGC